MMCSRMSRSDTKPRARNTMMTGISCFMYGKMEMMRWPIALLRALWNTQTWNITRYIPTSTQSTRTQGHITATHALCDHIHQVAPIWTPSNTWFLGPRQKHLDQFSYFALLHCVPNTQTISIPNLALHIACQWRANPNRDWDLNRDLSTFRDSFWTIKIQFKRSHVMWFEIFCVSISKRFKSRQNSCLLTDTKWNV